MFLSKEHPSITLHYLGGNMWRLYEPVIYADIVVPVGFATDLCSIPRIFWCIYPPFGKYIRAAIVHDWLILQNSPPKYADKIFLTICLIDGVPAVRAYFFYYLVRLWSTITRFWFNIK